MDTDHVKLVAISTFVLWGTCAAVGVVGIALPEGFSLPEVSKKNATKVEMIRVDLSESDEVQPESAPLLGSGEGAASPELMQEKQISEISVPEEIGKSVRVPDLPEIPKLQAVITPEAIVFPTPLPAMSEEELKQALEAKKPVAPVAKTEATPEKVTVPGNAAKNVQAPVTAASGGAGKSARAPDGAVGGNPAGGVVGAPVRLVYGSGAGRQPAPEYPYQARRMNQSGTVRVRFHVDKDGRVADAEVSAPCEFSSLNYSAVSTIRSRWRFPAGEPRFYEIEICFKLK